MALFSKSSALCTLFFLCIIEKNKTIRSSFCLVSPLSGLMKLVRMSGRNTRDKSRVVVRAARELLPQMHEQTIMRLKICAYSSDDRVHFALVVCQPHVQKLFCKMMITNMCMRSPNSSKKWTDYSMLNLFLSILKKHTVLKSRFCTYIHFL